MNASETIVINRLPLGSRMVQDLVLLLWATPVLISAAYLWATPLRRELSAFRLPLAPAAQAAPAPQAAPTSRPKAVWKATSPFNQVPGSELILQTFGFKTPYAAEAVSAREATSSSVDPAPRKTATLPPIPAVATFDDVEAVDGAHIVANGMIIAISGVVLRSPETMCKRLDGVMESCATRAASRLAVVTRDRAVECRLHRVGTDAIQGQCHAGRIDLAEDLIRADVVDRAGEMMRN